MLLTVTLLVNGKSITNSQTRETREPNRQLRSKEDTVQKQSLSQPEVSKRTLKETTSQSEVRTETPGTRKLLNTFYNPCHAGATRVYHHIHVHNLTTIPKLVPEDKIKQLQKQANLAVKVSKRFQKLFIKVS